MLPFESMNCRISETSLRSVCRELLNGDAKVSHRRLRAVLRERFGASGKTSRVLAVWHDESERLARARFERDRPPHPELTSDVQELQLRLEQAQVTAEQMRARAEIAELREQSHQDRWALEVDRLREKLRAQPNYAQEVRKLQGTVMRLTVEVSALRAAFRRSGEEGATSLGGGEATQNALTLELAAILAPVRL
jgi:hypothetical protein